jgi:aspartate racemase
MKKIGLVGGISWSSTLDYYRLLNEEVNKKQGGLNFAECIIYSVNFEQFCRFNADHNWDATFELLGQAAENLKRAGADMIVLCANTAHVVAERIRDRVNLPLIDIRVATALAIQAKGLRKVGLLGTVYTMEMEFYRSVLQDHGIEAIIPEKEERDFIEDTLVHELGKGIVKVETREAYLKIIDVLIRRGAEGIILGCTEIPLLIQQEHVSAPVFNTTHIHAQAAVQSALA